MPPSNPAVRDARSRLGDAVRLGRKDLAEQARRDLKIALMHDVIEKLASEAPLPTREQRDELLSLLSQRTKTSRDDVARAG